MTELAAPSYGAQLLQICLVLGGVCLLAYLFLRFVLPRLVVGGAKSVGPLKVVQRLPLEPRKTLYLVELEGQRIVVGVSDLGPMSFLREKASDLGPQAPGSGSDPEA